jgi:hypothetical protein
LVRERVEERVEEARRRLGGSLGAWIVLGVEEDARGAAVVKEEYRILWFLLRMSVWLCIYHSFPS